VAGYAELEVRTNFSFLTGASHPEELVATAARLGLAALGIADASSLAGIVRAHVAAKEAGLPLAVGSRLRLGLGSRSEEADELELLVFATDRASYGRLCRLLTLGKRRAPKGSCELRLTDLDGASEGLLAVLPAVASPRQERALSTELLGELCSLFDGDRLSLAICAYLGGEDRASWDARRALGRACGVPLVATNDVHYHAPERRALQDVLVCVREGTTLEEAGLRLFPNAERHLKSPARMERLFADFPEALGRSLAIAERASAFSLDELAYQYPDEVSPDGTPPMEHLEVLVRRGLAERYPDGPTPELEARIAHELRLIDELSYAPYFLTVHDIVRFARSRGILCQGRGAAANSAVCYCLGVTAVDPERIDLLFERFVSKERDEPPDIDVDFEHERREEVIQYVYRTYGRERAALTAEVITYRTRSAIRDVGKALGLAPDSIDRLAREHDWWDDGTRLEGLRAVGLDPKEPLVRRFLELVGEVRGFPRHLSQHVGGFVVTRDPLCELVPIENAAMAERTVIEWDKDDIDAMGMLKIDLLGLGMLSCIRRAIDLVNLHGPLHGRGGRALELHTIPPEDPRVYDMVCEADTVGVFQIESRAQMSMLPRLRPRSFYDLVIEVAIVRPGPIQGDMVHPYLRRRNGEEPVSYPGEKVRRVLEKTLGVPLFQEQAMALAMVGAGFSAGKADQLRRAMAAWRRKSEALEALCEELERGLVANGYAAEFARRLYDQILGFGEYGFPESHAASFALLVYVSAWLKRHHPAAFAAALINSQPMGFYAPAQIVADARRHGVAVEPVDVQRSEWDCTLERDGSDPEGGGLTLRLGMRLVKGLRREDGEALAAAVLRRGPFADLRSLHAESGVRASALRHLVRADAFRSLGLDRQGAAWEVRALRDEERAGGLWDDEETRERASRLPRTSAFRSVQDDYASVGLTLAEHPLAFLRPRLAERGVLTAAELADESRAPHGLRARTAGVVLVRQRPATASGILFMTLEDESGSANLIVRPRIFERFRPAARHAIAVLADGRVERAQGVVHLVATRIESLDPLFAELGRGLSPMSRDFR